MGVTVDFEVRPEPGESFDYSTAASFVGRRVTGLNRVLGEVVQARLLSDGRAVRVTALVTDRIAAAVLDAGGRVPLRMRRPSPLQPPRADGPPILGPDGRPIELDMGTLEADPRDRRVTYRKDGEAYSVDPEAALLAMARAKRDGWSNEQIIAEYQLEGPAQNPFVLNRALERGMALLDARVRAGREPAESVG